MSDEHTSGTDRTETDREIDHWNALQEYRLWKQHGRPSGPYWMKCLKCGDSHRKDELRKADDDSRRHAGVHSGLYGEDAEIVVTDATGRELWRHHAIYDPDGSHADPLFNNSCERCGESIDGNASCPHCGHVPEDNRLVPDGGDDV